MIVTRSPYDLFTASSSMSISSTGVMPAKYVLQRSYGFQGSKLWANSEFFETLERAELFVIQMKPFWTDNKEHRIIPTSEL
tara:strand:+ start:685 stop:927 length:243 start_codon:yes stop_codon:yes gene_type:complete